MWQAPIWTKFPIGLKELIAIATRGQFSCFEVTRGMLEWAIFL